MKKMKMNLALSLIIGMGVGANAAPLSFNSFMQRPKLVLVLVVDQLRADTLIRYSSNFLPAKSSSGAVGGFRYLMEQGAYYPFARYQALQNMTCPGHAMILTGGLPYQTHISMNHWFNLKTHQEIYCVEDERYPVVPQGSSRYPGLSPGKLVGSTVGDELKNLTSDSKVVTLALKDRAAIMLGGHRADFSFWLDEKNFQWATSHYYAKTGALPNWLEKQNRSLLKIKESKSFGSFKKPLASTLGVEITRDAALGALKELELGKHKSTDLLAVSFSSHDYLGHQMGSDQPPMQEMTVTEDRMISDILNVLKKTIPGGLDSVVVVLTADHGAPHDPRPLSQMGVDVGTLDSEKIKNRLEQKLTEKWGATSGEFKSQSWIVQIHDLNIFLNRPWIENKKIALETVENEVKSLLLQEKGILHVFTRTDFMKRDLPVGENGVQILRSYLSEQNGEVVIIPRPGYFEAGDVIGHMTGYSYDTTVPLIFAGKRFQSGVYSQPAVISDIASTLAFVLGVLPPSVSEGRVLSEALH